MKLAKKVVENYNPAIIKDLCKFGLEVWESECYEDAIKVHPKRRIKLIEDYNNKIDQ